MPHSDSCRTSARRSGSSECADHDDAHAFLFHPAQRRWPIAMGNSAFFDPCYRRLGHVAGRFAELSSLSFIAIVAAVAGVALGNYVLVKNGWEAASVSGQQELERQIAVQRGQPSLAPVRSAAPERYVCQGCDASLIQNEAIADDFQPFDASPLPPLPPYRPMERHIALPDIPVLAADRTAPDAVRRRSARPAAARAAISAAVAAVPVLAADRKAAPSETTVDVAASGAPSVTEPPDAGLTLPKMAAMPSRPKTGAPVDVAPKGDEMREAIIP